MLFEKMHVWTYLGATNRSTEGTDAECRIKVRPDMCYPHGLRAAVLGSAIEFGTIRCVSDAGGIVVDLSYHVRDNANVSEALVYGKLVRRGRSTSVTEGRVVDAADGRTIAYGTVSWVVPPMPAPAADGTPAPEPWRPDFSASTPAEGTALPSLLDAMGVYRLPGSPEHQIDKVRPEIAGGDWKSLHASVQQVMFDATTMAVASDHFGTDAVATRDVTLRMVTAGRVGPFVSEPTLLHASDRDVTCRVVIVDKGADDRVIAIGSTRAERLG